MKIYKVVQLSWTLLVLSAFFYFSYTEGPLVGLISGKAWQTDAGLESLRSVVYALSFSIVLICAGVALIEYAEKGK